MSIETTIDTEKNRVFHIISGILTFDEIIVAIKKLFLNPVFKQDMDIVVEIQSGATSALTSEDIHRFVEVTRMIGDSRGTGRSVVIASGDEDFGVLHVTEFLLKDEKRELKVVKNHEEADLWLSE